MGIMIIILRTKRQTTTAATRRHWTRKIVLAVAGTEIAPSAVVDMAARAGQGLAMIMVIIIMIIILRTKRQTTLLSAARRQEPANRQTHRQERPTPHLRQRLRQRQRGAVRLVIRRDTQPSLWA